MYVISQSIIRRICAYLVIFLFNVLVLKGSVEEAEKQYNKGLEAVGNSIDSSIIFYNKAISLFSLKDNYEGAIKAYISKSQAFCTIGSLDSAIKSANNAEVLLGHIPIDSLKGQFECSVLRVYGFVANEQGHTDLADSLFRKVREIAKRNRLYDQYLTATLNTGMVLRQKGDLISAFDFYNEAYRVSDTLKNYDMSYTLLIWMAQILGDVGQYKQALTYLNRLSAIEDSATYYGRLIDKGLAYGYVYYLSDSLEKALNYYTQSCNLARNEELPYFRAIGMVNKAEVLLEMEQVDSIQDYLSESLDVFEAIHNEAGIFYTNSLLGGYHLQKHNLVKAQGYLNKAEVFIDKVDIPPILCRNHYKRSYKLYKRLGNSTKALKSFETYNKYKQEIDNNEVTWSISKLERNLQLVEKERTIEAQQQKIGEDSIKLKLYRTRIGILVIVIVVAVFGFFGYGYWQNKNRQLYDLQMQQVLSNYELRNIQTQISPHFVFNTLNNMWAVFNKNNKDDAYKYLVNLSQLIRNTLVNSEKQTVSLKDEMDFVSNYLEIEALHQDGFEYKLSIAEEVDLSSQIIPMCIQTHVENAIKHGLRPKESSGSVHVRVSVAGSKMLVEIEDNGIGREKAAKNKTRSTGIGLKVQKEIIGLYNKNNKEEISIAFVDKDMLSDDQSGTLVKIQIPAGYKYILN